MDYDKEIEKTEENKLRDLTPEKDAKGGLGAEDLTDKAYGVSEPPMPPVAVNPYGEKDKKGKGK